MTRYWKTDQNVMLGLFRFIVPVNGHTYLCNVVLTGLADWCAFLELICQPCEVMIQTVVPIDEC